MQAEHCLNLLVYGINSTLVKGDQLFKFIGKFRYLGMENLRQEFLLKNSSVNVELLENRTG